MFENSIALLASMNSWFTPTVLFVLLNLMIGTIALTSTLANQNKHHNQTKNSLNNNNNNHTIKLARSPSLLQLNSFNFYAYKQQQHHQQPKQEIMENPLQYMVDDGLKETAPQDSENLLDYFQQEHQENGEVMNTQYHFEQTQDSSSGNLDYNGFVKSGVHHLNQETEQQQEENEDEDGDELQSLEEVYSKVTGQHVSRTKSDTEPSSGVVSMKLPRKMRKSASMKSAFAHFEAEDIVENRRPATVRERHVAKVGELDEEVDARADDFITKFKQQLKLQRIDSLTRYKEMLNRISGK